MNYLSSSIKLTYIFLMLHNIKNKAELLNYEIKQNISFYRLIKKLMTSLTDHLLKKIKIL